MHFSPEHHSHQQLCDCANQPFTTQTLYTSCSFFKPFVTPERFFKKTQRHNHNQFSSSGHRRVAIYTHTFLPPNPSIPLPLLPPVCFEHAAKNRMQYLPFNHETPQMHRTIRTLTHTQRIIMFIIIINYINPIGFK